MKTFYLGLAAAGLLAATGPGKLTERAQYRRDALRDPAFRPAEQLRRYRRYDFAPLLLENQGTDRGFIGPNCQRLRIRLRSVRRDPTDSARYLLTGRTLVRQQRSDFTGTLVLRQVRELRHLTDNQEGTGDELDRAFRGARREGLLLADYELRESPGRPASGVFKGVMRLNWYVSRQGRLRYDKVYGWGDGFNNNEYVGTWTSYATGKTLRANWGDYRIPNSGDFDIGAGEFSPADKYMPYGWQDMRDAISGNEAARRREAQKWWQ